MKTMIAYDLATTSGVATLEQDAESDQWMINFWKMQYKGKADGRPSFMAEMFDEHLLLVAPDIMAYESAIIYRGRPASTRAGYENQGALKSCYHGQAKMVPYAPSAIKKQVTGNGSATKQMMVEEANRWIEAMGYEGRPLKASDDKGKSEDEDIADALMVLRCAVEDELGALESITVVDCR